MKIATKSIWRYTIVYCDSIWGLRCAERISDAIVGRTGIRIPVVPDNVEERDCEILVGKTSRRESIELRSSYDRPNLHYDIRTVNDKLVCMGEGYLTLDRVATALERMILSERREDLNGEIESGDIRNEPDENMIDRAVETDIRVFDWNLAAPDNTGPNFAENAEKVADVILRHLPDIISTNELYDSNISIHYKRFYDAIMRELSPYYTPLKSSYFGDVSTDEIKGDPDRYGYLPEMIFYRCDAGIEVLDSGFRYTPSFVAYHGYHWAIFERDKQQFLFTVGHYEDCRSDPLCAQAHMEMIRDAQERSGIAEKLPEIITGDLFTHIGCENGGYAAFAKAGYIDAQRSAEINCNRDIGMSTYHHIGTYQPRWASIDLILHSARVKGLKFKVITSQEALDVSDHCPVCADLKFN